MTTNKNGFQIVNTQSSRRHESIPVMPCAKIAFPSEAHAVAARSALTTQLHIYHCPRRGCGGYHLTKEEQI
jgi:hypothetical protein